MEFFFGVLVGILLAALCVLMEILLLQRTGKTPVGHVYHTTRQKGVILKTKQDKQQEIDVIDDILGV